MSATTHDPRFTGFHTNDPVCACGAVNPDVVTEVGRRLRAMEVSAVEEHRHKWVRSKGSEAFGRCECGERPPDFAGDLPHGPYVRELRR